MAAGLDHVGEPDPRKEAPPCRENGSKARSAMLFEGTGSGFMVDTLHYRGRTLLLVDDDGGTWLFCGRQQAFLNRAAGALVRRLVAADAGAAHEGSYADGSAGGPAPNPRQASSDAGSAADGAAAGSEDEVRRIARFLDALPPVASGPDPGPIGSCGVVVIGGGPSGLAAAAAAAIHLATPLPGPTGSTPAAARQVVLCDPRPGGLLNVVPSVTLGLMPGMAFRTSALAARLIHAASAAGAVLHPHAVASVRRDGPAARPVFQVRLDDDSIIEARAVVLAVGMTGPLYRACVPLANVSDDFLPGNLERHVVKGTRVVLVGCGPGLAATGARLASMGCEVRPFGPNCGPEASAAEALAAWEALERDFELVVDESGGAARLRSVRSAAGCEVSGDAFVFNRSYFTPRLPRGLWPERLRKRVGDGWQDVWPGLATGRRGQLRRAGFFACGDATPGSLGVSRAMATGFVAGQAAAAFAEPATEGLSWAELPLRLTRSRP